MLILFCCAGNGDRSPFGATKLQHMVDAQGRTDVTVESAGVIKIACAEGGSAPELAVQCALTYAVDLSGHLKRWVGHLDLGKYDLFIAADGRVREALFSEFGITDQEIICLDLDDSKNAWLSQDPMKVHKAMNHIIFEIGWQVLRYKFPVEVEYVKAEYAHINDYMDMIRAELLGEDFPAHVAGKLDSPIAGPSEMESLRDKVKEQLTSEGYAEVDDPLDENHGLWVKVQ